MIKFPELITSNVIQFPVKKQPIPVSKNFVLRRKVNFQDYEPNGKYFVSMVKTTDAEEWRKRAKSKSCQVWYWCCDRIF
ncbi:MAG: hypothetical protein WCK96_14960 [Methylococcales bacterium]